MRHPNVVSFFGAGYAIAMLIFHSLDLPRICIVLEYCDNGALGKYMEEHKNLAISRKVQWLMVHAVSDKITILLGRCTRYGILA